MNIFYKASKSPLFIRVVYRLSTGENVLLVDNHKITSSNVGQTIKYPDTFVCSPPFGIEELKVMTSESPFQKLQTTEMQGYSIITEDFSQLGSNQTRGFIKKADVDSEVFVKKIFINTFAADR